MTDVPSARRRAGRPPLTSRTSLVAAAREIGFRGLSVGAVTARVGVKYSTFYRHIASFESLVTELVDRAFDEAVLLCSTRDWRTHLRASCAALFDLFAEHPGLAEAMVGLPEVPRRLVELYRDLTDLMLDAGFSAEDSAIAATYALELAVLPWIATEHGPGVLRIGDGNATTTLDPRVRTAVTESIDDPPREWTARKIELLIDGLTAGSRAS